MREKLDHLSINEKIILFISALFVLCISIAGFLRLLDGAIIVGLFDLALCAIALSISIFTIKQKYPHVMRTCMVLIIVGGIIATTVMQGSAQIYWLFPGMTALFFMVRPITAVLIAIVTSLIVLLIAAHQLSVVALTIICIALFATNLFVYLLSMEMDNRHQKLMALASKDFLTDIGNRRAFEETAELAIESYRQKQQPSCLVLFDLDNFKKLNDEHGHQIGDQVLQFVANCVRGRLRKNDNLFRVGGEEFALVLFNCNLADGAELCESLRLHLHQDAGNEYEVTGSFGVAQLGRACNSLDTWLKQADDAMYRAKKSGKDRVCASYPAQTSS